MDHSHKTWLWRKKSTERMIVASDEVKLPATINEEEIQTLRTAKAEWEKDLISLNNKLSACQSECQAKDGTIKKHVKMAEEAMAGWEKAEVKAANLKQELDSVSRQRAAGEERSTNLEGALKECMRQLYFVREEQEQMIHDAVMKASTEFERSEKILGEKLAEANQRNAKLAAENTHLSKALLAKERSNEDLIRQKARMETDLNALLNRLQSTEKDIASLKYEVQVLEKELEIRNEEREFNRRAADVSHKQHLESVKKIAKLESECQRLRLLVQKRLPGPAAMAKMRSEVDSAGRRRTKSDENGFPTDSTKQDSFLTEKLYAAEVENKSLKEALDKKANELQVVRSMYARTTSKLSQFELCLDESSKGQPSIDLLKRVQSVFDPYEQSHALVSDVGSDKISCAESWASALISELEHFKHGKQRSSPSVKTAGASDISLMDDFAEMERLAVVSIDNKQESQPVSCDDVTVSSGISNIEIKFENSLIEKAPVWLNSILKVVMDQARITQNKPHEILEDVRVALADRYPAESSSSKESANQFEVSNSTIVSKHVSLEPANKHLSTDSSDGMNDDDALLTDSKSCHIQTDLGKSILKIIELVEGISLPCYNSLDSPPYMNAETSEYAVRVFQWKTSELGAVLLKFVQACYDLLNGKSDVSGFAQEVTSALDWVINHCFSIQDVSSMEDAIKKRLDLDETQSESEAEKDRFQHVTLDENMKLNEELVNIKSAKVNLEERLQSALESSESLMSQLQKSEATVAHLRAEVDALKMSKAATESRTVEQNDAQLQAAKIELKETHEKLCYLKEEIENKNSRCDELEATCDTLQLQLESARQNIVPDKEEEKQLRTDREITTASEKLVECQETILKLEKQFKALATSTETTVATTTTIPAPAAPIKLGKQRPSLLETIPAPAAPIKLGKQRPSLLDQMLAEDKAKLKDPGSKSSKMKQSENDRSVVVSNEAIEPLEKILLLYGSKTQGNKTRGTNLWRKLLWRTKKSRPPLPTSHGQKD